MKSKVTAKSDLTLALAKRVSVLASGFLAEIRLLHRDKSANAKSLMGVIALSFKKGAELLLAAEGKDAARAIEELKKIL